MKRYSEAMIAKPHILCLALLELTCALAAETPAEAARQYITAHKAKLTQEFSEFLSIPNVAADPANLKRNADLLVEMLKKRNVESRLLSIPGAPPVVYGQITVPGARHTIVFYAQLRRPSQGEYSRDRRFQYGGYWFAFVDPWPSNWLYTQDVFVVEITCATRCIQASTLHSASHLSSIGCGDEAHSTDGYWRGSIAWARAIRFGL